MHWQSRVNMWPDGRVARAPGFPRQAGHWLAPMNHNFLRLTRILRSLSLLGLEAEAQALLAALENLYQGGAEEIIGARTLAFWRGAVTPAR